MQHTIPLKRIKNSFSSGWNLTKEEVSARRKEYGSNHIVEVHGNRWLEIMRETALDPMIWFLVLVSILFAILKNYNQMIILLLATIPLIGMDAFLHWRTQASTRSLSSSLATYAKVIRNKLELSIPAEEIVPGDLILISAGNYFPADGVILTGNNIQIDESALTGESYPCKKSPVDEKHFAANIQDLTTVNLEDKHWGYAGTRVLTGSAMLRAVYTGKETLYGEIVVSAESTAHARTPLQHAISRLVYFLIIIAIIFCIILATVRYLQGFGMVDAILSAAVLAVAALPDEFPVVFTFFLGLGVYRLARQKALVRRGVSVENIGRITCICTDKTGTITEGKLKLSDSYTEASFTKDYLLKVASLASREDSGDLMDLAILDAANVGKIDFNRHTRLKTFPFTEDRRRETALTKIDENKYLFVTKGAPEKIMELIGNVKINNYNSKQNIQHWIELINRYTAKGYKVIACAQNVIESAQADNFSDANYIEKCIEPVSNFDMVGLLIFSDPYRKEVPAAIKQCKNSGIHVLMVTGDHPETARTIASEIGLGNHNPKVITMQEAEPYLNKKQGQFFLGVDVIARVMPSQKLSIVEALQSVGEIVAATGDGVNDVPALKAADIGIAMGERGTQSAREISDIVLLDDNFNSIVNAISEGRQLFNNLRLSFKYLLLIHTPFVLSAAIIPLLSFPLLYFPIHIVWIELLIHPTSMLVFQNLPKSKTLEPVSRKKDVHLFLGKDWWSFLIIGLFTTLSLIFGYVYILDKYNNLEQARSFSMAILSFSSAMFTLALSYKTITAYIMTIIPIMLAVLSIQVPAIAKFLSFGSLDFREWIVIVGFSMVTFALTKIFN